MRQHFGLPSASTRPHHGELDCWGRNDEGQVGDGNDPNDRLTPFTVPLSGVVEVAAGGYHTCARTASDEIYCWGDNGDGQVGDGTTTTPRNTPVLGPSLSGVVELAAGRYHTCARLADGTIECWGDGSLGQLGYGSTADQSNPVTVVGISTAVAVAAGHYHTCALLANGDVACWGANWEGELGNGNTNQQNTPAIWTPSSAPAFPNGYTTVTTGSGGHWQITDSTFFTDGDPTSDIASGLTNEATTFVAGELKDAGSTTGPITLAADAFTEIEFALQATTNAFADANYCFRLYDATGTQALDTYTTYAQVELGSNTIYRSVGTNGADLNTGAETVEIAGSTATFSGPMSDDIGVGDVLVYNSGGPRLAYIHGRSSSTVFTVMDSGAPTAAPPGTAVGVFRAYTSLENWDEGIENPNINEPTENDVNPATDLVATDTVMMVACYGDGEDTTSAFIEGWTTGPDNYIKIYTPISSNEVGRRQRHDGKWSTSAYRISNQVGVEYAIQVEEQYVRIEGLQVDGKNDPSPGTQLRAIYINDDGSNLPIETHVSHNIVRMSYAGPAISDVYGIVPLDNFASGNNADFVSKVWNNIVYGFTGSSFGESIHTENEGTVYAYNNTCIAGPGGLRGIARGGTVIFHSKNNISIDAADPFFGTFDASSTNNVSDTGDAPGSNPIVGEPLFVDKVGNDYHLDPSDPVAADAGLDLSSDPILSVFSDIDMGARQSPWDVGADDIVATTAVDLLTFEAHGGDGAVELVWETGSEVGNLGFHVYRGPAGAGPYARLTASPIPGLGSSPAGARYSYRDTDLVNGETYFYLLEDIETTGRTERHGPVFATPETGAALPGEVVPSGSEPAVNARVAYGNPSANSLRVVRESGTFVELGVAHRGVLRDSAKRRHGDARSPRSRASRRVGLAVDAREAPLDRRGCWTRRGDSRGAWSHGTGRRLLEDRLGAARADRGALRRR